MRIWNLKGALLWLNAAKWKFAIGLKRLFMVNLLQPPHPCRLIHKWNLVMRANLHRISGSSLHWFMKIIIKNTETGFLQPQLFRPDHHDTIPYEVGSLHGKLVSLSVPVRINHALIGHTPCLINSLWFCNKIKVIE